MMRFATFVAIFFLSAEPVLAQKDQKPNPESATFQPPLGKLPLQITTGRTVEVLRAAGILNVRSDTPFTLSARQPYLDPQTFLTVDRGSLYPERNVILMNRVDLGLDDSRVELHWFGNLERRYVVDCVFAAGSGTVRFEWLWSIRFDGTQNYSQVSIIDGRAAIVLPMGVTSTVNITTQQAAELSSCEVTPFDA